MPELIESFLQNHKLYKLLCQIAKQDGKALETLFRDYSAFIYSHIMNYTSDKDIGEDILQEVFIRLYQLKPQNIPNRNCTGWLVQVIHNTAYTYLARLTVKTSKDIPLLDSDKFELLPEPFPEDDVLFSIDFSNLLQRLDTTFRQVLLLRYQGYSFEQIAAQLQINSSTARSKYSRTIQKLKIILEEQHKINL